MGATVTEHVADNGDGIIHIKVGDLRGGTLYCDTPSHTGTENLIMAAALARGTTLIKNAALEPEVLDNIAILQAMGAKISGGGTGFVTVEGVDELTAVEHTVMPDRIDAGVFVMAAAITGGDLNLVGASLEHLGVAADKLEQMGVEFHQQGAVLQVRRDRTLRPINVITDEYPGFATDLQSPIMALSCLAEGPSYVYERIFDGRFKLADELRKMGADIEVDGNRAKVNGPRPLRGAEVEAHDLRCGSALVLAGLAAEGETTITSAYYLDRGHAHRRAAVAARRRDRPRGRLGRGTGGARLETADCGPVLTNSRFAPDETCNAGSRKPELRVTARLRRVGAVALADRRSGRLTWEETHGTLPVRPVRNPVNNHRR